VKKIVFHVLPLLSSSSLTSYCVLSEVTYGRVMMGRYFGVPLEELVYRENCNVPSLVLSCATFICSQGM